MKITLRKYQQEAIDSIFKFFYSGKKGNPLVVIPTGGGKSYVIAGFCQTVIDKWPDQKILIISHIKEILQQNYNAMKNLVKNTDIGLYSSGLKSKKISQITIAGIQSICNSPEIFDQFNIILVDEAHSIPHTKNGRYHKFFNIVQKRVVGFTATPFRLGYGYLHLGDGAFFDEIVYTVKIKNLQDLGHLCKLTAKGTKEKLNTDGIKKQGGDFVISELSIAFDRDRITKDIVSELLLHRKIRKKWLLFAIDIKHAEHITKELIKNGIKAQCVHSKLKTGRDKIISDFKKITYAEIDEPVALVSVAVLTTGFDVPDVDLIGLIRPTASVVLHIQIIGRGLRPHPDKEDCIVLDFAGNLLRNGPIDSPIIKLKGSGTSEPIMKECSKCYEIVHAAVRTCPCCGFNFIFRHNLTQKAADKDIICFTEWFDVDNVTYDRYIGRRKIPMLKVTYLTKNFQAFKEFVCFEHGGYAALKANRWWSRRSKVPIPTTAKDAETLSDTLKKPKRVLVEDDGKFCTVKDHVF